MRNISAGASNIPVRQGFYGGAQVSKLEPKMAGIRIRRRVAAALASVMLLGGLALQAGSAEAAGPNYCKSTERFQLYYDGYVQVQASYSDRGRHAKNGWLRYTIPGVADSGMKHTKDTPNKYSTAIRSRSYRFWDSWDWSVPPTKFSCGYNWWR